MNRVGALALLVAGMLQPVHQPRAIMAEVQKRASAVSQEYEGALKVIDAGGKTLEKRWIYQRIGSSGQSKVVIRFTAPAEVKGVALLVVNYPDRLSDQWMWTPAINRERRIASQDRRTRFFGTDFSFEDLEERDVDQYQYSALGDETIQGEACWKIGAVPLAGKRSQYTNSIYWVRQSNYTFARIENFDGGRAVRRLTFSDLQEIQGIRTARVVDVEDFARQSHTVLTLESIKYNVPVTADRFTIAALRQG
jgi:outer membrane lipoprotein-sorting protein